MVGRLRGLPSESDQQAVALDLRTGHRCLSTGAALGGSRTVEFGGQPRPANHVAQLGRACGFRLPAVLCAAIAQIGGGHVSLVRRRIGPGSPLRIAHREFDLANRPDRLRRRLDRTVYRA